MKIRLPGRWAATLSMPMQVPVLWLERQPDPGCPECRGAGGWTVAIPGTDMTDSDACCTNNRAIDLIPGVVAERIRARQRARVRAGKAGR